MDAELKRIGDLLEKLVVCMEGGNAAPAAAAPTEKPAKKKPGRPKGSKKKAAKAAEADPLDPTAGDEPATKSVDPTEEAGDDAAPALTRDDALDALREFVTAKGNDPAKAVLKEFGAGRVSELKESDYGNFIARLSELS